MHKRWEVLVPELIQLNTTLLWLSFLVFLLLFLVLIIVDLLTSKDLKRERVRRRDDDRP
jgi:hypothetical protein